MRASVGWACLLESGERERGSYAEGVWERACKRAGLCVSARGRGSYAEGGWDRANWRVSVCVRLRGRGSEEATQRENGSERAGGRPGERVIEGMRGSEEDSDTISFS